MSYCKFKTLDYGSITADEHIERLKFIITLFITYGNEETFKKVIMFDESDYTILLLRDLKMKGLI